MIGFELAVECSYRHLPLDYTNNLQICLHERRQSQLDLIMKVLENLEDYLIPMCTSRQR